MYKKNINKFIKLSSLPIAGIGGVLLITSATDTSESTNNNTTTFNVQAKKDELVKKVEANKYSHLGGGLVGYQIDLLKEKINTITDEASYHEVDIMVTDFIEGMKFNWSIITTASMGDFTDPKVLEAYKTAMAHKSNDFDFTKVWSQTFWNDNGFKPTLDEYKNTLEKLWKLLKNTGDIAEGDKLKTIQHLRKFGKDVTAAYAKIFAAATADSQSNRNAKTFFQAYINFAFNRTLWPAEFIPSRSIDNLDVNKYPKSGNRYIANWNAMYSIYLGDKIASLSNNLQNGSGRENVKNFAGGYNLLQSYNHRLLRDRGDLWLAKTIMKKFAMNKYYYLTNGSDITQAGNPTKAASDFVRLQKILDDLNEVPFLLSKVNFTDDWFKFSENLATGSYFNGALFPKGRNGFTTDLLNTYFVTIVNSYNGLERIDKAKKALDPVIKNLETRITNLPTNIKPSFEKAVNNAKEIRKLNEVVKEINASATTTNTAVSNVEVAENILKVNNGETLISTVDGFESPLSVDEKVKVA
ncbi:hypothetical protein ACJA23_01925 [Mycoplasma corogypsi]|uniref:hypothetical protein n=1 Tax=Mycoplasma corogypsi TaxID=2106 RepID=UPI003872B106